MKLFVLLLLLSPSAFAGVLAGLYPFTVMPAAECSAKLKAAFAPEETIKDGLQALAGLNTENTSSCIDELAADPEVFPRVETESDELPPAQKIGRELAALRAKTYCYNPETSQAWKEEYEKTWGAKCGGKWITIEEKKAIQSEYKQLQRINQLFTRIPHALQHPLYAERAQLKQTQDTLNYCKKNPYAEGTYEYKTFQNTAKQKCDGKVLTEDELKAKKEQIDALNQTIAKKKNEGQELVAKVYSLFGDDQYIPDYLYDRREKLLPLIRNLVCFGPAEGTPEFNNWKWDKGDLCDQKPSTGTHEDFRSALLAELGDLGELKANLEASRKAAEEERKRVEEERNTIRFRSYSYRRLFTRFQNFLASGGSTSDTAGFCATYQKEMEQDKVFIEQSYPQYGKLELATFDQSDNWKILKKYGLSEGEWTALTQYTGSFYSVINPPLYKKFDLEPWAQTYRTTLNSALAKIPAYKEKEPLLRFATLPKDVLEAHKVGEVVTYDSFTSTSKKKNWNWSGNARFVIYSGDGGKDLLDFNDGEAEVLFPSGSRFKVLSKTQEYGKTNFVMVEVDQQGQPLAKIPLPADFTP